MSRINAELAPHSWTIESWPAHVFPNNAERARYLVRVHRDELFAAGVLSRVGRELVILGARYVRWVESKKARVPEYDNGAARARKVLAHATCDAAPPGLPEQLQK